LASRNKAKFLPYQERWLKDTSRIKVWEKSRRIGATYVQAYEDVKDCVSGAVPAVWFSSADLTAAREYIGYCEKWARAFKIAAENLGEQIVDLDKGVKAYTVRFANGARIHALSSNPSQFRSKGGKVVLDEFAFHDDQKAMWAAARPVITWGYPLRILSTHNGKSGLYYKFVEQCKEKKLAWSLHTTTIFDAVAEGLADKILGRELSDAERAEWIEEEHRNCADEITWQQEYCCIAVDEATAFLTYEMIERCERDDIERLLSDITGDFYVGMDVARKRHLSVIWGTELVHDIKITRFVWTLKKQKFAAQRAKLYTALEHPRMRRACIDATGIGMQLSEEAQDKFGKFRVEQVTFTNAVKADLAHTLYIAVEDVSLLVPKRFEIKEAFHSIRKMTTSAGNVRIDAAEQKGTGSHADEFWAAALSLHAISAQKPPLTEHLTSGGERRAADVVRGYA
jgi:phage FluMu gp28-like protein